MFGFVTASVKELDKAQQDRYGGVYCGICREIRTRAGQTARLGLSYDMAFLALLLMSLYEPEETSAPLHCAAHALRRRSWVSNRYVEYAADMNVALAYYHFLDDWHDDGKVAAKWLAGAFGKHFPAIEAQYPRQCGAIREGIRQLGELEEAGCTNPDGPAGVFGELMGALLVYEEDLWAPVLRQLGQALGRFIYLLDAAVDYDKDRKRGKYNPWLAMGMEKDNK